MMELTFPGRALEVTSSGRLQILLLPLQF
jgi:hypothetical protein